MNSPRPIFTLIRRHVFSVRIRWLAFVTLMWAGGEIRAAESPDWQPVGWGGGGFYWSVVFHPKQAGTIYMGGDVDGVYKTEDHGKHWKLSTNGLVDYAVYSLAIDPSAPETVYAGTEGGLCKTVDGGAHWQFLPETAKDKLHITAERDKSVRVIAIDPIHGQIVYAGTPQGKIYKSQDGGTTWTQVYAGAGNVASVAVSPKNPALICAATLEKGIVRSDDAGKTWTELPTPKHAVSVAMSTTDENLIFGAFASQGIEKSIDGGKSWTACSPGNGSAKVSGREVAISPTDARDVYCITGAGWGGNFYASHDGGQTWTESSKIKYDRDADPTTNEKGDTVGMSTVTNLAISPADPRELFISANWRPCYSEDAGKTWVERDRGADISCVFDIRFRRGRTYVTCMDEGTLASDDAGAHWRQLWPLAYNKNLSGHNWRVAIWDNSGTDRILSTCNSWDGAPYSVVLSDDGGKTFRASSTGLPATKIKANTMWGQGYLRALAVDPRNPKIVYAGIDGDPTPDQSGGGIFKSEDAGETWQQLANQPASRRMFFGLAVDPTDSNRLYWAATGKDAGPYRSDDGGKTWQKLPWQDGWIFNFLVTADGTLYCPAKNLWRSKDHGQTWTRISDFQGDFQIVGLEVDPRHPETMWLSQVTWGGTEGAVRKTTDGGKTWVDFTGNLPYRKPMVLRFNPETNELWAGGVGLFKVKQ